MFLRLHLPLVLSLLLGIGFISLAAASMDETAQREAQFRLGKVELDAKWHWGANIDRAQKLYSEKDWVALSDVVIRRGPDQDLPWFYLGNAANGLGFVEAARMYFRKSIAAHDAGRKCGSILNSMCNGFSFPDDAERALAALPVPVSAPQIPSEPPPKTDIATTPLPKVKPKVLSKTTTVEVAPSVAAPAKPSTTAVKATDPVRPSPDPVNTYWSYTEDQDPMTDAKVRVACVTSTNMAILKFPYKSVTAELCIRRGKKKTPEVLTYLNGSGQFLCSSYDGCTVAVRFDDKQAIRFDASRPSDNSTNALFLSSASKFTSNLKASTRTRVQVEFFQQGTQVLEFPTAGLRLD